MRATALLLILLCLTVTVCATHTPEPDSLMAATEKLQADAARQIEELLAEEASAPTAKNDWYASTYPVATLMPVSERVLLMAGYDVSAASPQPWRKPPRSLRGGPNCNAIRVRTRRISARAMNACKPVHSVRHRASLLAAAAGLFVPSAGAACDPALKTVTTPGEMLGKKIKYLFTNHRKNCDYQNLYASIGKGNLIKTEKYGNVPVIDFVKGDRVYQEALFLPEGEEGRTRPKLIERKIPGIKQLVVLVSPEKQTTIAGDGITFTRVKNKKFNPERNVLTVEETKQVLVQRLLETGQVTRMLNLYPEERKNLAELKKKYSPKTAELHRKDLAKLPAKAPAALPVRAPAKR